MGKQRNTSNKNQSHLLLFCMLFPRAIKTIVARWVALEDDGNSEEEEGPMTPTSEVGKDRINLI